MNSGSLECICDERGARALRSPRDPFGASVTDPETALGLIVRYRVAGGAWADLGPAGPNTGFAPAGDGATYARATPDGALLVSQTFAPAGQCLDWTIEIASSSSQPVEIGDLAVFIPVHGIDHRKEAKENLEKCFLAHPFICGAGSFVYYVRGCGVPPFLVMTVHPGTHIEYVARPGGKPGAGLFYVHSALAGSEETRGDWRQEHTSITLRSSGERARRGFRLQFADSYDAMREILYREGLFDIRAVPGMVIPEDLTARFSLRTRARIHAVEAEYPSETTIVPLNDSPPDHHIYEVAFKRLGENRLTIRHDDSLRTHLEFFVTEPLEVLIKKRAAFLVRRQQVRDPSKWWDGVYGPYDMKAGVTRTIDDPDIFTGRMIYVLTCDDPGLCKAPFLAAKNVHYPDRGEIESLEYYLEHFVWGKLQRTDAEEPYPYGVYGTPHWHANRNPEERKKHTSLDPTKEHVWRSYDYPHMIMLYFHLYEVAKKHPGMCAYLDAGGYLERAWGTAKAFFEYPYRIIPTYYETYKQGLYNELVVLDLAEALDREGFPDRAAWLRAEWEKKVKYFVYGDPYPYSSEYSFDRTAFESSHALARYGATRDMKPDRHQWWDVKDRKWHSHPVVRREDSRAFMDRQLAACLAVRGWLEASYYQLGADVYDDPKLSYMTAMGGWGILDYGLNFSNDPFGWLQLGYASYLCSWCLMNTGRPETEYGYWSPGPEKDGAAGWQFMGRKYGRAWMGADVPRGPWHYDGEIDLGFGAALRMAMTLVARDPVFGWIAYGGVLSEADGKLSVIPRDGLRKRFAALLPDDGMPWKGVRRFRMELDRDGWAPEKPILMARDLGRIAFVLENRPGDGHVTGLRMSLPAGAQQCRVLQDGTETAVSATGDWDYPWRADLKMQSGTSNVEIHIEGGKE